MGIDTLPNYHPLYQYPVYLKIVPPEHNDYTVGDSYDMRIEDNDRQNAEEESGPYNYVHETLLVGIEEYEFGNIPPLMLALLGNSKNRGDALETVGIGEGGYSDDREVLLLTFLRKDAAKELVESGEDIIPSSFGKESVEDSSLTEATED